MAAADHGGTVPDLHRLLGVEQSASAEELALAWRPVWVERPRSAPLAAGWAVEQITLVIAAELVSRDLDPFW